MGNTPSSPSPIVIQSPKNHCPMKPFPYTISKPLEIPKQNLNQQTLSRSLPSSFENKIIHESNDGKETRTMGGQVSSKDFTGHYITQTYFKNYSKYDSESVFDTPSF